jgi:flagellar basal body-associated protein FliL
VITVETVNPILTFLLVILFLALVVTIVVLAWLLSKARGEMSTARTEAARAASRQKAAAERAREAEEQAARLMHAVEVAVATARRAVDNKDQLELVNQQLAQLFAYVSEPLEELPGDGPALTGQYR